MSLITNTDQLNAFIDLVREDDFIAIDTEFLREKTYWPQLCLVQIAGSKGAAAIDPLAPGLDLAPLIGLLDDPGCTKVFHAARQDLEIFLHLFGRLPTPIFDTQVAAMVCGFGDSVSYETLATRLTSARIDKSSRFTDWSQRPLTDRQLSYALSDVVHLRPVYEKLRARLAREGRATWLDDEMAILREPATYRVAPDDAWKRLKPRTEKPRFLAILRELAAWREREAQHKDLPRNRVLRDEALLEIAAHAPAHVDDLARTRGFGAGTAHGRYGTEILAAITKAKALPDELLPRLEPRPEIGPGVAPLVELLRVLLKMVCDRNGVAARLVASAADLEAIALDDDAAVPALSGWRRHLFGEAALHLKQGRLALAVSDKKVRLVDLTSANLATDDETDKPGAAPEA
jgi:ribonuclease D